MDRCIIQDIHPDVPIKKAKWLGKYQQMLNLGLYRRKKSFSERKMIYRISLCFSRALL
jgi:hypothetical protein